MERRSGFSLVEVLVALTLFGIGGALSGRLLAQASLEMEGAELGLRAALLLSDLSQEQGQGSGPERAVGPGRLVAVVAPDAWIVRFEPGGAAIGSVTPGIPGARGNREAREWRLEASP
jgi:prepilin-type N-terminal cleavage/methylation domain-containing protein